MPNDAFVHEVLFRYRLFHEDPQNAEGLRELKTALVERKAAALPLITEIAKGRREGPRSYSVRLLADWFPEYAQALFLEMVKKDQTMLDTLYVAPALRDLNCVEAIPFIVRWALPSDYGKPTYELTSLLAGWNSPAVPREVARIAKTLRVSLVMAAVEVVAWSDDADCARAIRKRLAQLEAHGTGPPQNERDQCIVLTAAMLVGGEGAKTEFKPIAVERIKVPFSVWLGTSWQPGFPSKETERALNEVVLGGQAVFSRGNAVILLVQTRADSDGALRQPTLTSWGRHGKLPHWLPFFAIVGAVAFPYMANADEQLGMQPKESKWPVCGHVLVSAQSAFADVTFYASDYDQLPAVLDAAKGIRFH
ncbi:MAG: hypothetical protein HYR64_05805 [Fimbriimonas ginsengisoli]|uniref:Uncharacterized protein n=1 Tax=Fimbriimonas ginsengisoli TaxID=1005039 RepID=A0A931LSE4_FIMGI|nr:hypothetical protein [Fimbriimonas ginsengisoli]